MKKWHYPFLLFLIIGTVFIINKNEKTTNTPFQSNEGMVFGTVYHIKYQSPVDLHNEITATLKQVDNSLSMFNPQSCISQINNGTTNKPDSLFIEVFNLSRSVSQLTDGCFDPTVAPLVNAWGFGKDKDATADSATIDSIMEFVGWKKIEFADGIIVKKDERITLDFSAIAKGYGADLVARMFETKGLKNYMIEIGGEIVCKGINPKGSAWKIGINKPIEDSIQTQAIQSILSLNDCAMATSGNYRNFYVKDGKKIAHTINPKNGHPIQRSIVSSTILAPTCAMADAIATAVMVMGLEKAKEILINTPDIEAYLIYVDEDGSHKVWHTEKIGNHIE